MGAAIFPTKNIPRPTTQHYTEFVKTLPSMAGKTVAVTGCTSGTGLVLAETAAKLGARVVMINRPSERADKALKTLTDGGLGAVHLPCDLQSFASVREAGAKLKDMCSSGLDVLCCNAGVMGLPDQATGDGFDVQMQSNHLSHFLLVSLAMPVLEAAARERGEARVIQHSSGARNAPKGEMEAKYLGKNGGKLGGLGFRV